jgi:hypothetical protein
MENSPLARSARPASRRPDDVAKIDELEFAPPEQGLNAAPDPAEVLEEVLIPGAVDGPGPEDDHGEAVPTLEDLLFGLELAFTVLRDRPGRVVLADPSLGGRRPDAARLLRWTKRGRPDWR